MRFLVTWEKCALLQPIELQDSVSRIWGKHLSPHLKGGLRATWWTHLDGGGHPAHHRPTHLYLLGHPFATRGHRPEILSTGGLRHRVARALVSRSRWLRAGLDGPQLQAELKAAYNAMGVAVDEPPPWRNGPGRGCLATKPQAYGDWVRVPVAGEPSSVVQQRVHSPVDCGRAAVVTCSPYTEVADAARTMMAEEVGALAVMEDTRLVGIVTERDLLKVVGETAGAPPCWENHDSEPGPPPTRCRRG